MTYQHEFRKESLASKILTVFGLCIVMPCLITYGIHSWLSGSTARRVRENVLLNHKTDTELWTACMHSGNTIESCRQFLPQELPQ